MAKQATKGKKTYYICEECGFAYKDRQTAMKCENWCRKHHSCNMEITRHSVELR